MSRKGVVRSVILAGLAAAWPAARSVVRAAVPSWSCAEAPAACANLDFARTIPTLFKPEHSRIVFAGLTVSAQIRVHSLSGRLVAVLEKFDATDRLAWGPVVSSAGKPLASGTYLYTITAPGVAVKRGKFMVFK